MRVESNLSPLDLHIANLHRVLCAHLHDEGLLRASVVPRETGHLQGAERDVIHAAPVGRLRLACRGGGGWLGAG